MELDWYQCTGGVWCELFKLDLSHKYLSGVGGVYIIWSGTSEKSCLKIGHGNIQDELKPLAKDLALKAFSHLGVYVTWADVSMFKRKGVHKYLESALQPKFSGEAPEASPVEVELPW